MSIDVDQDTRALVAVGRAVVASPDREAAGRSTADDQAQLPAYAPELYPAYYVVGQLAAITDQPPTPHDRVHYVEQHVVGDEVVRTCRAATVTGVGAWLDDTNGWAPPPGYVVQPGDTRVMRQTWHAHAASLTVLTPTGILAPVCQHDESHYPRGDTWHYPGEHCEIGGTR